METIKPKGYIPMGELKKLMPNCKVAYTIEHYSSAWWDGNYTISSYLKMDHKSYVDIMTLKFNCINYDNKLFFNSIKQCKEAIEFFDIIKVLYALTH